MTAPSIPGPEDITAAWLTARLREAGHSAAEVRDFSSTQIGTGQIGKCIRYDLDLASGDADTPTTLVGKFASDDPTSRQTGVLLNNFIKEVSFYREVQSRVSIRTPRCYYAAIEGTGPTFALLMEDLAPAVQGDQLAGCSAAVARAAVLELVGLHAPSWCDESYLGVPWLGHPDETSTTLGRELYRMNLPAFLERFGPSLDADEAAVIELAAESTGPPFELLGERYALVHFDYRLDNLLIDEAASSPRITAVDWQSVTVGRPLGDVAYFLGAGLLPEVRREHEKAIVRAYHAALGRAGVEGFDWDECWNAYRRGVFSGFAVTVIASVMVQQTERGDEMFVAMARRHARHALDLGSDEFLR